MRPTSRKVTGNPVMQRILELLKEQGKTEKELIQYLGLANGAFTPWKFGDTKGYMKYIEPMSTFFEVSHNYLLRGVDDEINPETLSIKEIRLIQGYRKMTEKQKKNVLQTVSLFTE